VRTIWKSLSAILFWLAALIYFATTYDMSIYTITMLKKTPQINEIFYAILYALAGSFLLFFSFFQFKKSNWALNIFAFIITAVAFVGFWSLLNIPAS